MNNSILVEVANGRDDSLHDCPCLAFGEEFLTDDLVEKFSSTHQLKDEVNALLLFKGVAEGYDVGVLTVPKEDLYLIATVVLSLVDYLDGVLLPRFPVDATVANGVAAAADSLLQFVLIEEWRCFDGKPGQRRGLFCADGQWGR